MQTARGVALMVAGLALIIFVVMGTLNFLGSECSRGTPHLTWYFNCFQQR
jgi:hypothetical protein